MNDRLQKAFDTVRADESIKAKTRAALSQKTRGYQSRPRRRTGWAVALACVLLALGLGAWGYLTPVCTIRINVNPSIELGVNWFDRVVSVQGRNEDGQTLLAGLQLEFLNYAEALNALLADEKIQGYLEQGKKMSITVACDNEERERQMVDTARACANGQGNVRCHGQGRGKWAQAEEAAESKPESDSQESTPAPESTRAPESTAKPECTPAPKQETESAQKGHGHQYRHGHGHK